MQSLLLAAGSVPAETSEFFRAELEAFIAMAKSERPAAWRRVEQLQRVCRNESPATAAGRDSLPERSNERRERLTRSLLLRKLGRPLDGGDELVQVEFARDVALGDRCFGGDHGLLQDLLARDSCTCDG